MNSSDDCVCANCKELALTGSRRAKFNFAFLCNDCYQKMTVKPYGVIVTASSSLGRQQVNYHPALVDQVLDESKLIRQVGRVLRFETREEAQAEADRLHQVFYANWSDKE